MSKTILVVILSFLLIHLVFTKESLVPNTFVIEFEKPVNAFASKRHLLNRRSIFYEQLNSYNIQYEIRHEYELINAVSVAFKTPHDSFLFFEKALGVKKAWPVNTITKPKVFQELNVDSDTVQPLFSLYNQTGVIQLRNELGMTGQGIKVGIIDTGVDYTHPGLGGCYGPECRVAYGYDFVGDEYNGENTPIPDNDPMNNCNGHGTHVTGIIGANDSHLNFTGIAPEVTFGAYRIFGCKGTSTDDIIMSAMEKAYLDGMDVINLSLGDVGWPESPASLLADELALKGMIVCAAAGNAGEKGIFQVGAPSLGKHALSVASIDNTHVLSHTIQLDNNMTIGYVTPNGNALSLDKVEIMSVANAFKDNADGCEPLEDDVSGKVILFNRGGCMFSQKVQNAQNAGAIGALIYNNVPGQVNPSIPDGTVSIPYGGMSQEDGYVLFEYLKSNPKERQVTFLKHDMGLPIPTAGTISVFSSWGLGPDLSLKPDISAPGGQIYSTFPLDLGGYATLSGTSMASPYVAGIVALIQQTRGGKRAVSAQEVRSMLINNGQPFHVYGLDQLESVARQGAGLINVYQAVRAQTTIVPEQLRLGDIEHGAKDHEYTFTIKNNGRISMEYTISHVSASTAQGYDHSKEGTFIVKKPILLSHNEVKADVYIPTSVVSIDANEEVNVTVRISPPTNSNDITPYIYSGYIVVTDDNEGVQYVPYAGFTWSLSKLPVLMVNTSMPNVFNTRVTPVSPCIITLQLAQASQLLTVSAVNSNDPSIDLGYIPGGYSTYTGRNSVDDPSDVLSLTWHGHVVSSQAQAASGPLVHQSKIQELKIKAASSSSISEQPGNKLPNGTYKLKVMALRPFGSAQNPEDFDVWFSPDITIT